MNANSTARLLGWLSIGLGLAEVVGMRKLSKAVRLEKRPGMVRMFGLREIATGIGILSRRNMAPWLWARVGGDAMDLAALGTAFTTRRRKRRGVGMAAAAVLAVTALDVICGRKLSKKATMFSPSGVTPFGYSI